MANRFVLNETSYHGKGAIDQFLKKQKQEDSKKL